jgi:glycosyltransferase involved in cell wall biosynthesis
VVDRDLAPLRVLMINGERGWRGGENQVSLLVRGLGPAFLPITACLPDAPLAQALTTGGCQVRPVTMRGQFHLGAVRALRRIIRDDRIDVVHAHTSHAHALGLLATIGSNVPLVVTRRVDFAIGRSLIGRWKYGKRVTRFVAVSAGVQRVLEAGGVDAERIEVIHDGIDPARFAGNSSTLRAELGIPANAVVFGVVAHLTDHKDHRTLLTAFAEVERARPDAWLVVVGTGELEAELKALAITLLLKRTVFTGFRDDVPNVLRGLDVGVLSSHLEGLGSTVMDYCCCGLAVVATRAGGIPELITDNVDGLLVPPRDPPALAIALLHVATDAALRSRLGAAGRITAAERFGATRMVAAHEALYRRLAAER